MNTKAMAEVGRLAKYPVGSHLYGTNTPTSDLDFCGVFVAPKEFYLGLATVEEVDFSVVSKQDNGRNDQDAIDFKLYELRKFVKLALENNPNIIEQLFVPEDKFEFVDPVYDRILRNRHLFPHQGAKQKFMGYALSQRKKMLVKRDNMNALLGFQALLEQFVKYGSAKNLLADHQTGIQKYMKESDLPCKVDGQHIRIGDTHFQRNITVQRALSQVEDRVGKFSGRFEDFVSKHGYDTKFASHLIRLLLEGQELLMTGEIKFPLAYADQILDIKNGNWTVEEVIKYADDLENLINDDIRNGKCTVPAKPRYKEVEELLMTTVEDAWYELYGD